MREFFILFFSLLILSCANQGNIFGGLEDETPPELIASFPENRTLNFTGNSFELLFNENIKVVDLSKNLLVSPFLNTKPEIKVKPRSISVELQEELKPNTTYTFNFGNSIQDVNEGNELAGFTYVFSTGEKIDSASVSGKVLDSEIGDLPEKGAWVTLYNSAEDSLFRTTTPSYASPIKEDGSFSIQNIKDGEYRVFALRDNNFNYYYDLPNEQIAFTDSLITIVGNVVIEQPLSLFVEEQNLGLVRKILHDKPQSMLIETTTEASFFSFDFFPEFSPAYEHIHKDSIRLWLSDENIPDSSFVYFKEELIDTIKIRKREFEQTDSTFKVRVRNDDRYNFYKPLFIESKTPFELNEKIPKAVLLEDSLFVAGGVDLIKDSINPSKYFLDYDWEYGRFYTIEFDDSSFTNLYSLPSDSLSIELTIPAKEKLGTLNISFISEQYVNENIIFQLLDGDDIVVERQGGIDKTMTINNLGAKNYFAKVIIDSNNNGIWDTGNFEKGQQPELILVYNSPMELNANWDLDVGINLDQ